MLVCLVAHTGPVHTIGPAGLLLHFTGSNVHFGDMTENSPTPEIDVRKVAQLSRLEVAESDIGLLARELASILAHARDLEKLDLAGVEPLSHAADLEAELAWDEASGELPREALESIAPKMDGPFIAVPKVLGGDGGSA